MAVGEIVWVEALDWTIINMQELRKIRHQITV
jgi:hypothetical protein